jgi:predicted MFS family arabinose efflux permease
VSEAGRRQLINPDATRIITVQALRALAYGAGSVLIGVSLKDAGLSGLAVGAILASLSVGSAIVTVLLGRFADWIGRRRCYLGLLVAMALAGAAFALTSWPPLLILAALTGTVSPDVVESGPFTSLEQAMLSHTTGADPTRLFGRYNTVATLAGSLGAALAALLTLTTGVGSVQRLLLIYPLLALAAAPIAAGLSTGIERGEELRDGGGGPLEVGSRPIVRRLAGLFALDSFGGGFVVQTYIAYYLARRFNASPELIGSLFFSIGVLQALSFQTAVRLSERIGLLPTMVFTHLPSNLLLAAVPLAPNLPAAVALLLGRFALSQMDVPPRQAYVVTVVQPAERTAAAAYTNGARYATRPIGSLLTGALVQASMLGAPFVAAGAIKAAYDVSFWQTFRRVPLIQTRCERGVEGRAGRARRSG